MVTPNEQRTRAAPVQWSEQMTIDLFMAVHDFQTSHGVAESINWGEVSNIFRARSTSTLDNSVIKNKFDNEKRIWRLWNSFRATLGDAVYDPATNTIVADDFWWAKKTKQNYQFRSFRKALPTQQLSILMDDVYHRIPSCHNDAYAPVANDDDDPIFPLNSPPRNPYFQPIPSFNGTNEGVIRGGSTSNPSFAQTNETMWNQYNALNNEMRTPPHMDVEDMMRPCRFTRLELGSGSGSGGSSGKKGKSFLSPNSTETKGWRQFQKIRNMYNKRIESFKKRGDVLMDALESELFASTAVGANRDDQGFRRAMVFVNQMVLSGRVVEGSRFWCFIVSFLKEPKNTTAFLALLSNELRITWIQFEFEKASQFGLNL